jgi:hypothetical protein
MTKSNKWQIIMILLKFVCFSILLQLYGEYVMSRDFPGFIQLVLGITLITILVLISESVYKNLKTIYKNLKS